MYICLPLASQNIKNNDTDKSQLMIINITGGSRSLIILRRLRIIRSVTAHTWTPGSRNNTDRCASSIFPRAKTFPRAGFHRCTPRSKMHWPPDFRWQNYSLPFALMYGIPEFDLFSRIYSILYCCFSCLVENSYI